MTICADGFIQKLSGLSGAFFVEFSVEGDRVYNPSAIPVYLKVFTDADEGKLYCIKPGTETPLS